MINTITNYRVSMTRITTIALMALMVVILVGSTAYANNGVPSSITELETEFTGFETFLTDLSNEVNTNMVDIVNLQGNVTALDTRVTTLESDVTNVNTQLSALPEILQKTKTDSNSPTCEVTPYPFTFNDWCPNSFVGSFDISDTDVTSSTAIVVSLKGSPLSICGVTDIDNGMFRVKCNTGPTNGAELHYILVN